MSSDIITTSSQPTSVLQRASRKHQYSRLRRRARVLVRQLGLSVEQPLTVTTVRLEVPAVIGRAYDLSENNFMLDGGSKNDRMMSIPWEKLR